MVVYSCNPSTSEAETEGLSLYSHFLCGEQVGQGSPPREKSSALSNPSWILGLMEVKVRKAKDRIVDSHSGVWAHEKSYAKCSNIRGICGEKVDWGLAHIYSSTISSPCSGYLWYFIIFALIQFYQLGPKILRLGCLLNFGPWWQMPKHPFKQRMDPARCSL
jgi:hypothetical protein